MRQVKQDSARKQAAAGAWRWQPLLRWIGLLVGLGILAGLYAPQVRAEPTEVEYAKGVLAYSNRAYPDALEHLRKVIARMPDHADAQFYLGLTLTRLGDFEPAIAALERVLQLDPTKQYVHYHLGLAYLQGKRYQEALSQLQRAAQFDPQKAATQFYLGQVLSQLKRHSEAPPYFQRALELDPTLTDRAQYYQGLAFYATEHDTQAQTAFQAVVRQAPGTALAQQAQRYLEAIAQRESAQRLVQVQGALSLEYDDNVILEPNTVNISNQADGRAVINAAVRLLPLRTPTWRLGAEYALFQSLHFDLTDFDILSHTAGIFAQYTLPSVTLHATANYNYSLLDNERFSEAFTLQPSAVIKETESWFTVASLRYRQNNYFESIPAPQESSVRDRDGWAMRVGAQQYWLFNQRRAFLSLGYAYEANRGAGTDWEADSHELSLGLQTPLAWGLTLNVQGAYTYYDYLHVNSFADGVGLGVLTAADTRERVDNRLFGAVTLSRPLGRYLTVTGSYAHTTNFTNIDFFAYHRNIWSLTLTGRY